MKNLKYNLMLMLTSFIWGSAFVAQKLAMDYVESYTFNSVRSYVGAIFLIPVIMVLRHGNPIKKAELPMVLKGGLLCGIALTVSMALQQLGIAHGASAGKAGFLTALYIIIVPILGLLFGRRCSFLVCLGVVISLIGTYLLCVTESGSLSYGDILLLCCALSFSFHILIIDHFAPKTDCVLMSAIQFLVVGVLSMFPMYMYETPSISNIVQAWKPIFVAGVLSSGVAYTLQIVSQKHLHPTIASLIMSLESVFAALMGWLIANERLSFIQILGCALVFVAILLAQAPTDFLKTKRSKS